MHRQVFVDRDTGLRLHGDCLLARPSRAVTALVWPAELAAFRQARGAPLDAPRDGLPAMHPDCLDVPEEAGPVILSPSPLTPYATRPDAPPEFQRLALSAAPGPGASVHYWYVDGRFAGKVPHCTPCFTPLEPGDHDVVVTDDLGRSARTTFSVRPAGALGSLSRP
jgi:penicillin-binding protein 1C